MLVIPGILTRDPELVETLGSLRLPALQRLLARGRRETGTWPGIDAWLMERFNVEPQTDWPSAPFALLGEGEAPGEAHWVHADAVSLRADRDRLLLVDATTLEIKEDEAQALQSTLEQHFADSLRLIMTAPGRWYGNFSVPPEGKTLPLAEVAGGQIEPGRGAMAWHAIMNEMQMLLHEHPVNEAREARGEPPINGIWLWGAGRLAPASTPFRSISSALPLARGLGRQAGIAASLMPANAGNWIRSVASEGIQVCVIDTLLEAAKLGNAQRWLDALARLEQDWFAPLVGALEAGQIGMLTLHLGGARTLISIEAVRGDLRRFWRRAQQLDRTLVLPEDVDDSDAKHRDAKHRDAKVRDP